MNITTKYMGLALKNPIIASSSTLTGSADEVIKLDKAGVGAVVLKSIFEEEILGKAAAVVDAGGGANRDNSSEEYINYYIKQNSLSNYLDLIKTCKKKISVPVIASINCRSAGAWIDFARQIEGAGADALEVNIFLLPAGIKTKISELEKIYLDIARMVSSAVSIPVALKVSPYFTNLASMFNDLSITGIKSLVLFNRFYNPDINLSSLEFTSSSVYSSPSDIAMPLRWIGILSGKLQCDFAATTGVHDGDALIKVLLAGAKVAEIASALYIHGYGRIQAMQERLEGWMKDHRFNGIEDFRGRLSQENISDPSLYERAQFMKYYSGYNR